MNNQRRADAPIPQRWARLPNYRIRPEDRAVFPFDPNAYAAVMQRLRTQTNELQTIANDEAWARMRRQNGFFRELAPRIEYVLRTLTETRNQAMALMATEYRNELARIRETMANFPNPNQMQDLIQRQEQFLTGLRRTITEINLPEEDEQAIYDLLFPGDDEAADVAMGPPDSPDSPSSVGSSTLTAPPSYSSGGRNGAGELLPPFRNQQQQRYDLRPRPRQ